MPAAAGPVVVLAAAGGVAAWPERGALCGARSGWPAVLVPGADGGTKALPAGARIPVTGGVVTIVVTTGASAPVTGASVLTTGATTGASASATGARVLTTGVTTGASAPVTGARVLMTGASVLMTGVTTGASAPVTGASA